MNLLIAAPSLGLLTAYNRSLMSDQFALRLAQPSDFAFCQRLYFEGIGWIIEALKLDLARQREGFGEQWQLAEVRIITVAGKDVGWLQTMAAEDAIFIGQLHLEGRFQRQGIGSRVMRALINEAMRERKAVTLGVVKINPARRLYDGWDLASPVRIISKSTCGVSRIGYPYDRLARSHHHPGHARCAGARCHRRRAPRHGLSRILRQR
jgi:ribosomal protein S18 acetylase RimI-like enzyme